MGDMFESNLVRIPPDSDQDYIYPMKYHIREDLLCVNLFYDNDTGRFYYYANINNNSKMS